MNPDSDFEEPSDALRAVDAILDGVAAESSPPTFAGRDDDALMRELGVLLELAALHRRGEPPLTRAPLASIRRWGHLQIRRQVGRGSFGDVFQAWDPRLSRDVALKLLDVPTSDDPARRDWVLHEARCLAAVRHPNVVTVYGADRLDGRTGFWTEFIRGRTLAELVASSGPLEARDAAPIGVELCAALAAVHHAGLLHRDVKASNAMRDGNGRVVLLDFGASRDFAAGPSGGTVSTGGQGPTGTPLYVAPELWRGAPATPRSDIYSLGVLLYFLVTGAYPVRGARVRDVDLAHRSGRRVGLSDARRAVPASYINVVERATDPDPAKRFASAAAFGDAIRSVSTELNRPPGFGERVARGWRGVAAIVALLLLTVFAGYLAWPRPQIAGWGMGLRVPDGNVGHASRDGRRLPYVDRQGDVRVVDVATGDTRLIEAHDGDQSGVTWHVAPDGNHAPGVPAWGLTALSPQGDRIAYAWFLGAASNQYELRLADTDATHVRTLIERRSVYQPTPVDWTADGRNVLCWLTVAGNVRNLVLVSTSDGSVRVLYSYTGWLSRASISPDGRFVALEQVTPGRGLEAAIIDATGRDPRASPRPLFGAGQSASPTWVDATHLAVIRPESGDPSLGDIWIADVVNGAVIGSPICVLRGAIGFGPNVSYELTDRTSMQLVRTRFINEVYRSAFDVSGRTVQPPPAPISATEVFHHLAPSFSPNGRRIAYLTGRPQATQFWRDDPVLTIEEAASGAARQVLTALFLGRTSPQWLADGRHVMVQGAAEVSGTKGEGWYAIDVDTGVSTAVVPGVGQLCKFLPDARGFIVESSKAMGMPRDLGLVFHPLPAGPERLLVPWPEHGGFMGFAVSPDSKRLAFETWVRQSGVTTFRLEQMDIDDAAPLDLVDVVSPEFMDLETWTADSRRILYVRGSANPYPVWSVAVTGGAPTDAHLRIPRSENKLSINTDGTGVVYPDQITEPRLWIRPLPLTPLPPARH